jgi:hypothetical protein
MNAPDDEPVGNVGDEAAKLLGALADWAGDHFREVDDHIATGAAECLYCPVCRTVHAVREANPEVKAQLAQAASTLLKAAAGLLAAAGSAEQQASKVQHIDLDPEDEDLDEDLAEEHDEDPS